MRPSKLRSERQQQYNYLTGEELQNELKKQVEDKKAQQMQSQIQNQQEIIQHYKNYQLGSGDISAEDGRSLNDLQALMRNKERELEMLQNQFGPVGFKPSEQAVFQGDMNAFNQRGQPYEGAIIPSYEKSGQRNLFDDHFLSRPPLQVPVVNNENNQNIVNGIFGNNNPPAFQHHDPHSNAENEREKRLRLREMERMKRQEGQLGGGYGQIQDEKPPAQSHFQNNIFGEQQQANKRDQIWQQKMQQKRGESADRIARPTIQPQVQNMLPINQNAGFQMAPLQNAYERRMPESPDTANLRNSRVHSHLNEAKMLDQSLNFEQEKAKEQAKQKQINAGGILPIGNDDLIQRRRENDKKQMQQEYQQFIKKQQQPQDLNIKPVGSNNIPSSQPTSSQSQQRPSYMNKIQEGNQYQHSQPPPMSEVVNPLLAGGLSQIGIHQMNQQEDKLRKQKEYRDQLDQQNKQKLIPQPVLDYDRKKEISDQIFAEVLSSHQKIAPSQGIYQIHEQPIMSYQQPNRNQSAKGMSRKEVLQDKQSEDSSLFFKNQQNEDDIKKAQLDKKKEYAMQLQQQMALKQQQLPPAKRRGTSQVVPQQLQQPGGQQIQLPFENKQPFEYQNQGFSTPLAQQMIGEFNQYQFQQPNQWQAPSQLDQFQAQQPVFYDQQQIGGQPPAQNDQLAKNKQKQEEYRRDLEMQIKLRDEQQKMQALQREQDLYQIPPPVQPPPESGYARQRTDLNRITKPDIDIEQKQMQQQRYQEELKRQMEENKKLKDQENEKIRQKDAEREKKFQEEQERKALREQQEILAEGRRDPNNLNQAQKAVKKSNRLFKTSQEIQEEQKQQNEAPQVQQDFKWPDEPVVNKKEELFGKNEPNGFQVFQLPTNSREEDIFQRKEERWQQQNQEFQAREMMFGNPPPPMPAQVRNQVFEYQQPQRNDPYQGSGQNQNMGPDVNIQQKMLEEQSKMLIMYQQALEQILNFKTQYLEQAMQMRETIVKEKEQLLEYEKIKQQQNQEIVSLQAVYSQLSNILTNVNHSKSEADSYRDPQKAQQSQLNILNPQVQNNLNSLILNQKQQIMRLSQNGSLQQHQQPRNDRPNILEQSLSSETKLVHIQQNKLAQMNQAQNHQNNQDLFQTWTKEQLPQQQSYQEYQQQSQQNVVYQPQLNQSQVSLQGSSQFIQNQFQQTPQKNQLQAQLQNNSKFWGSRPATSQLPETIQELPNQEDDMNQTNKQTKKGPQEEFKEDEQKDLNSRSSSEGQPSPGAAGRKYYEDMMKQKSDSSVLIQGGMVTGTNPLANTTTIHENIMVIEKMVNGQTNMDMSRTNQMHQNTISPNANSKFIQQNNPTATQSSFYNKTAHHDQLRQQTQQEEFNKQIMRIMGETSKSNWDKKGVDQSQESNENFMQQIQNNDILMNSRPQKTQPNFNPLKIAAENEKLQYYNVEGSQEQEMFMQSQINIANSLNGTNGANAGIIYNSRFTSNNFNPSQMRPHNDIIDESKVEHEEQQTTQGHDIALSKPPTSHNHLYPQSLPEEEEPDLWNDPDLIPPPVVHDQEDFQDSYQPYEIQYNYSNQLNKYGQEGSSQSNQFYSQLNQEQSVQDKTIRGLKMLSPPNVEDHQFNLGVPNEGGDLENRSDLEESKEYQKPLQNMFSGERDDDALKSVTKKEKDMREVQQLILQATNKANNLFENSDNFKFKLRSDQKQNEGSVSNRKQPRIKIVDPFKQAEQKSNMSKNTLSENATPKENKDQFIIDNLDKIINDLQKQKTIVVEEDYGMRQQEEYEIQDQDEEYQGEDNNDEGYQDQSNQDRQSQMHGRASFRPVSATQSTTSAKVGKYTQMALLSNTNNSQQSNQLGKFAQLAIQTQNPTIQTDRSPIQAKEISDLNQKYMKQPTVKNSQHQTLEVLSQQQILRPVSGKSNSTRYQIGSSQSNRRNVQAVKAQQQQPFYDDESEENQSLKNSNRSGYNIGQPEKSERGEQQTFRPQNQ